MYRRLILAAMAVSSVPLAVLAQPPVAPAAPAGLAYRFLTPGEMDPTKILPPPAPDGSPRQRAEQAELHRLAGERSPERLAQAQHDNDHEDPIEIASVLGPAFDLARFPATAKVLQDVHHEDVIAARQGKEYFRRPRPYVAEAALDMCDKGADRIHSYPSGHATMGFAAAAILSELMPGNAQLFQTRAADYGESRLYCGVHYRSDIDASQVTANVMVAKLLTKPAFQAEVEAARRELTEAHIAP